MSNSTGCGVISHALHFRHLELDIGVDHVVGEHAAHLEEAAVGVEAHYRFAQEPHTVGILASSAGGRS